MKREFNSRKGWVSIEEFIPKGKERVIVTCESVVDGVIERFQTIAMYIPPMTVSVDEVFDENAGISDYDKVTDVSYAQEGFYEQINSPKRYRRLTCRVTHWMWLPDLPKTPVTNASIDEIIEIVAKVCGVNKDGMFGKNRLQAFSDARSIAWYFMSESTTATEISKMFNRHPSSISCGLSRVRNVLHIESHELTRKVSRIKNILNES